MARNMEDNNDNDKDNVGNNGRWHGKWKIIMIKMIMVIMENDG